MSLLTKGGAGKSLPQGAAADAANAVQNAIGQLADKYGVDLDANAAAAEKAAEEEQKSDAGSAGGPPPPSSTRKTTQKKSARAQVHLAGDV